MWADFSTEEIDEAARTGRLLALEVELGLRCDGGCDVCGTDGVERAPTPEFFSHRSLERVLTEARALGARRVTFLDGGGLDYPHFAELLAEVRRQEMEPDVRVGSRAVGTALATRLAAAHARIGLSRHGLTDETHDRVEGRPGSAADVRRTLEDLRAVGYPEDLPIAVQTRICRANLEEIVPLWRWARTQGLAPHFENGERRDPSDPRSGVDPRTLEAVFAELATVDRTEFGRSWDPQPPWPGRRDLRPKYSCLLSATGVAFAPGLPGLPIGDVRPHGLARMLQESEVLEDLRVHDRKLKGPCRSCENLVACAGSRSAAHALTGDYLASDPTCWRNLARQDAIVRLPLQLADLLPQKAPMRLVDALVSVGDRIGECAVTIRDDMPVVSSGTLDAPAYLEIIAQAMAALQAFSTLTGDGAKLAGFLVGAEELEVLEAAVAGDRLRVCVRKETRFGKYGIVSGTILRGDSVLARGRIKIWQDGGVANV